MLHSNDASWLEDALARDLAKLDGSSEQELMRLIELDNERSQATSCSAPSKAETAVESVTSSYIELLNKSSTQHAINMKDFTDFLDESHHVPSTPKTCTTSSNESTHRAAVTCLASLLSEVQDGGEGSCSTPVETFLQLPGQGKDITDGEDASELTHSPRTLDNTDSLQIAATGTMELTEEELLKRDAELAAMEDVLEQSSAVCTNECAMTKPESALPEKTGTLTHENPQSERLASLIEAARHQQEMASKMKAEVAQRKERQRVSCSVLIQASYRGYRCRKHWLPRMQEMRLELQARQEQEAEKKRLEEEERRAQQRKEEEARERKRQLQLEEQRRKDEKIARERQLAMEQKLEKQKEEEARRCREEEKRKRAEETKRKREEEEEERRKLADEKRRQEEVHQTRMKEEAAREKERQAEKERTLREAIARQEKQLAERRQQEAIMAEEKRAAESKHLAEEREKQNRLLEERRAAEEAQKRKEAAIRQQLEQQEKEAKQQAEIRERRERAVREEEEAKQARIENRAAVKMQAVVRGHLLRTRLYKALCAAQLQDGEDDFLDDGVGGGDNDNFDYNQVVDLTDFDYNEDSLRFDFDESELDRLTPPPVISPPLLAVRKDASPLSSAVSFLSTSHSQSSISLGVSDHPVVSARRSKLPPLKHHSVADGLTGEVAGERRQAFCSEANFRQKCGSISTPCEPAGVSEFSHSKRGRDTGQYSLTTKAPPVATGKVSNVQEAIPPNLSPDSQRRSVARSRASVASEAVASSDAKIATSVEDKPVLKREKEAAQIAKDWGFNNAATVALMRRRARRLQGKRRQRHSHQDNSNVKEQTCVRVHKDAAKTNSTVQYSWDFDSGRKQSAPARKHSEDTAGQAGWRLSSASSSSSRRTLTLPKMDARVLAGQSVQLMTQHSMQGSTAQLLSSGSLPFLHGSGASSQRSSGRSSSKQDHRSAPVKRTKR